MRQVQDQLEWQPAALRNVAKIIRREKLKKEQRKTQREVGDVGATGCVVEIIGRGNFFKKIEKRKTERSAISVVAGCNQKYHS